MCGVTALVLVAAAAGCRSSNDPVAPTLNTAAAASATALAASATPAPTATATAADEAAPPLYAGDELVAVATELSDARWRGRGSCSDDERRAATWLAEQLTSAGIAPGPTGRTLSFTEGECQSQNVVGLIPGTSDEVVVVGAHYDHLQARGETIYPGAEDNASGVAVLLALAKRLASDEARRRGILLVLFGAEEAHLLGSEDFVAAPPIPLAKMSVMVNIDMIGRRLVDRAAYRIPKITFGIDDRRSVGMIGTAGRPQLRAIVDEACERAGVRCLAPEDFPKLVRDEIEKQARGRGDNWPFERAGVPAVFFSSGESDDYHQPSDTADKLDPAVLAARAEAIHHVVVALAETEATIARPK